MLALEGGNRTIETGENMKEAEIFEKFYACYFGKYFYNSEPPISLRELVQQRVEASLGSEEKVKNREEKPPTIKIIHQVPSLACVSWMCHPSLNLLRTPLHGFQVLCQLFFGFLTDHKRLNNKISICAILGFSLLCWERVENSFLGRMLQVDSGHWWWVHSQVFQHQRRKWKIVTSCLQMQICLRFTV